MLGECFFTNKVENGGYITGSYEVTGSTEGVIVSLSQPGTDVQVWTSQNVADHWSYTASTCKLTFISIIVLAVPGQYKLCFRPTVRTRQTVSFNLHVTSDEFGLGDYYDSPESTNFATKGQTEKVGQLTAELESRLASLLDHQEYAITREQVHRDTAESANGRVMWWSFTQLIVLILAAIFQLFYLKKFFSSKLII
jgi:hypothetical protein